MAHVSYIYLCIVKREDLKKKITVESEHSISKKVPATDLILQDFI